MRRGPYTGIAGWIGPDGAMATSILIRTFVADGERLCAPRRRRDHLAERARGGVGRDGREGARAARRHRGARGRVTAPRGGAASRPAHLDRRRRSSRRTRATCRRSIAGSSSATACSRRSARAAAGRRSSRSTSRDCGAPRKASTSSSEARSRRTIEAGIAALLEAEGLGGAGRRRVDPDHGQPRLDRRSRAAARGAPGADGRDPGVAGAADAGGPPRARAAPRRQRGPPRPGEPAGGAQDDEPGGLRVRAARGSSRRRGRRALPHHRRPPLRGDQRQHLPGRADAARSWRHPGSTARSCPGTTRSWILGWAGAAGLAPVEGSLSPARPRRRRRGVPVLERRRDPAGHPVRRRADRDWASRADGRCGRARPARRSSRATDAARRAGMTREELVRTRAS